MKASQLISELQNLIKEFGTTPPNKQRKLSMWVRRNIPKEELNL